MDLSATATENNMMGAREDPMEMVRRNIVEQINRLKRANAAGTSHVSASPLPPLSTRLACPSGA